MKILAPSLIASGASSTGLAANVFISASAPGTPIDNMLWYDTANSLLKLRQSGAWTSVGGAANIDPFVAAIVMA
jgi:hypothetical protein